MRAFASCGPWQDQNLPTQLILFVSVCGVCGVQCWVQCWGGRAQRTGTGCTGTRLHWDQAALGPGCTGTRLTLTLTHREEPSPRSARPSAASVLVVFL